MGQAIFRKRRREESPRYVPACRRRLHRRNAGRWHEGHDQCDLQANPTDL